MQYFSDEVIVQEDVSWSSQHGVRWAVLGFSLQKWVRGKPWNRGVVEFRCQIDECHCHLHRGVCVCVCMHEVVVVHSYEGQLCVSTYQLYHWLTWHKVQFIILYAFTCGIAIVECLPYGISHTVQYKTYMENLKWIHTNALLTLCSVLSAGMVVALGMA